MTFVGIAVLLVLPKLHLWDNEKEPTAKKAQNISKPASALPVEAMRIVTSKLDNVVVVTGSVQANESLELKSEAPGKITKI